MNDNFEVVVKQNEFVRNEIYEKDGVKYIKRFDAQTNAFMGGTIYMFDNIRVCTIYSNETIKLEMPIDWVLCHKDMLKLIKDFTALDDFLQDAELKY